MSWKTLIEPRSVEAREALAKTRRPNHAYILLETKQLNITPTGNVVGGGLFFLNVQGRPEQAHRLEYYVLDKRYRIIDYGNFPRANSENHAEAQHVRLHSQGKTNPWSVLETRVRNLMESVNVDWKADKQELERKLEEATAQLAKLKGGENAESERTEGDVGETPTRGRGRPRKAEGEARV